jgi:outer membrane protein
MSALVAAALLFAATQPPQSSPRAVAAAAVHSPPAAQNAPVAHSAPAAQNAPAPPKPPAVQSTPAPPRPPAAQDAPAAQAGTTPLRVLTLEEALRVAHERQPQLRQAHAGTEAAGARARQAEAPLLPQLSATAGYQRATGNIITRPGVFTGTVSHPQTLDTFNSFNSSVTANQLIYDFGQTTGRYHAFTSLAEATAEAERATALQVTLTVRTAFFDARANKSLVQVARESFRNLEAHLEQVQGFVEAGTRPDIDLVQARTDLANAQVQVISAENNYDVSRTLLSQAMGIVQPFDYDVADEVLTAVAGEDAQADALLDEAISTRPEITSLRDQVRAQQETLRSIQGAYGPALSASAGFTQGGTAVDHLGWNLSAGLTLSWQLYQGGFTKAQSHEAEANVAVLVAQLDSLRLALRVEVEQARLAVRAAKATQGAAHGAVENARERLGLAQARYETGIGSALELSDAQLVLTNAAVQAVQADYRLSTARAQLLKALGRQ